MANEVTHALLQTNGGQVASVLSDMLVEQLFDPTDLRALMRFTPWSGIMGSDTLDVTQDAVPTAFAAATNETTGGQSNTAYTTSRFSHTIARHVIQYQLTDLLGLAGGPIDLSAIIRKIDQGVALTFTDLLTTLFPSISGSVGTTTVDLVVDDLYDADFTLNNANASGLKAAVLHNVQMNDFRTSLRGETGAQQFVPATAEMLATKGPGFQGSWNGIDFWQSDSVETVNAAADRNGAMFVEGAFDYTMGPTGQLIGAGHIAADDILLNAGGVMIVERDRDATNGMSTAVGNLYPSVVEAEDARAVGIITDA